MLPRRSGARISLLWALVGAGACWRVVFLFMCRRVLAHVGAFCITKFRARVGAPVCGGGCSGLGLWLVGSGRWFVGGGRRARGAAWERILVVVVVLGASLFHGRRLPRKVCILGPEALLVQNKQPPPTMPFS